MTQRIASSFGCSTPSRQRPHLTTDKEGDDNYYGRWRKRVTFDTSLRSLSEAHDNIDRDNVVGDLRTLLGTKMGTPYDCKRNPSSAEVVASVEEEESETPVHVEKTPLRLIESGAVRVHIAQYTNPRRGANKHGSNRLIDQGAVRLQITRHTTPRKNTSRMMWSLTPSSSNKIMAPRTEVRGIQHATTTSHGFTPSKHRSNAQIGGHKFRAVLSPSMTTPIAVAEVNIETEENCCIRDLPRTLRFE